MIKRNKIIRKLTQSGCKSLYVTLPPKMLSRLGWLKGDNIEIIADRESGEVVLKRYSSMH